MRRSQKVDERVLFTLSEILERPGIEMQKKLNDNKEVLLPVTLKSNVSSTILTKIEEIQNELPGIYLSVQPIRNYLNKELAVHVLGYVGEVSEYELEQGRYKDLRAGTIIGKFGLERKYDDVLRGTDGNIEEEVDAVGRVVQHLGQKDPVPGKNLQLTIIKDLQEVLEKAVDDQLKYLRDSKFAPNARAAAAVAMDPRTGAIRAMVSRPAFDPNLFTDGISEKNWQLINNDPNFPMVNKVIAGEYPPGSTFKIVTGAAALELKKVTPEELIFDSGKHWLIPMGNAGGEALGWINFQTAMSKSDNVYFYEMGNRLGIDNILIFAKKFGLGSKTGIELDGEAEGLLPTPENKRKIFPGENWMLGDTFNAAIGQGIDLATPLQMATMMSAVAMDGVFSQPYLVEKVFNIDGSIVKEHTPSKGRSIDISKNTMDLIKKSLIGVASEGGTAAYFSSLPRTIAAKTGTAENPHGRDHGLFVSYGPADEPELVVAIVVEQGGYGSVSAAPIAYKAFEEWFIEKGLIVETKSNING